MHISAYELVFFGLLAVIPALVVSVVTMLRIETLRVSNVTMKHEVDTAKADVQALRTTVTDLGAQQQKDFKKVADLDADIHNTRCKTINLEESLQSLSNKLNSRERVERRNIRKEEEEEERRFLQRDEKPENPIPGTEQQILPLFGSHPSNVKQLPIRKFGTMP
jgi:hypothetical protein